MPYNILLKASAKVRAGSNTFGLRKLGKIIETCLEFIILSGEQLKGTSEAAMTKSNFFFLSFLFFHGCTQYFKSCYDSVHLESIHQQQFPCPRIHFLEMNSNTHHSGHMNLYFAHTELYYKEELPHHHLFHFQHPPVMLIMHQAHNQSALKN